MLSAAYLLLFSTLFGLVCPKPVVDNNDHPISIEQAFRQAEATLNRYFYLMNSDTDQLVHALLHIIINNPAAFPFVPHRALDIALKNFEKKLGQNDVDLFTKPLILSLEPSTQEKIEQAAIHLTPEVREKIENTLDQFFAEQVFISPRENNQINEKNKRKGKEE